MRKEASKGLTQEQRAEIEALANLPDEAIDTSDIPEILDWTGARRGRLYRPVKQQITLRLDADVVSWFKASTPDGRGYQTEINRALRDHAGRDLNHDSLRTRNITLSADENLIEAARRRAAAQHTTLNAQFRLWLADYVGREQQAAQAM